MSGLPAVISTAEVLAFDYTTVDRDIADDLRMKADRVRGAFRKITENIIAIGGDLNAAKERLLDHGQFVAWVESECRLNIRSAQRYMGAAAFAVGKHDSVSLLAPTTIYQLAARSAAPEVVADVTAKLQRGEIVSDDAVVAALEDAKRRDRQQAREEAARKHQQRREKDRKLREAQGAKEQERDAREQAGAEKLALEIIEELGPSAIRSVLHISGWRVLERLTTLTRNAPIKTDPVRHKQFGQGRVVGVDGHRLTVDFGGEVGRKVIVDTFVERVDCEVAS